MHRAALALLLAATALPAQEPSAPQPHRFFDKTNIALFSLDATVRVADAYTTRRGLRPGQHDLNQPDWIAQHNGTEYLYSVGASGLFMGLSYWAHRTGHHRIERFIPAIDVVYDGRAVVSNARVLAR